MKKLNVKRFKEEYRNDTEIIVFYIEGKEVFIDESQYDDTDEKIMTCKNGKFTGHYSDITAVEFDSKYAIKN